MISIEEENKAVARRYFEDIWNKGDLAGIEECFAPRVLWEGNYVDRDSLRDLVTRWRRGFPDGRYVIEHVLAEGDIVAANVCYVGTHRGLFHWANYGPWEPTGKSVDAREMFFMRFAEGKVVEEWVVWDHVTFVRQLGIIDIPRATQG